MSLINSFWATVSPLLRRMVIPCFLFEPQLLWTQNSVCLHTHTLYISLTTIDHQTRKSHLKASHSFSSNSVPSLQMLKVTGPQEPVIQEWPGSFWFCLSLTLALLLVWWSFIKCWSFVSVSVPLLWSDTTTRAAYRIKHLIEGLLTASGGKSMIIKARSMDAGRNGVGEVT